MLIIQSIVNIQITCSKHVDRGYIIGAFIHLPSNTTTSCDYDYDYSFPNH